MNISCTNNKVSAHIHKTGGRFQLDEAVGKVTAIFSLPSRIRCTEMYINATLSHVPYEC